MINIMYATFWSINVHKEVGIESALSADPLHLIIVKAQISFHITCTKLHLERERGREMTNLREKEEGRMEAW